MVTVVLRPPRDVNYSKAALRGFGHRKRRHTKRVRRCRRCPCHHRL